MSEQPAQPTYIDTVNETPPEKPEGSPAVVPLLQLPRRRRAEVVRKLGNLRERQRDLPDIGDAEALADDDAERTPEQEKAMLDRAAAMFDLFADFEELLVEVAEDPEAMRAWLTSADDQALSALTGYYMRTFQAGEAPASPAS
jgi:hypothetical protein